MSMKRSHSNVFEPKVETPEKWPCLSSLIKTPDRKYFRKSLDSSFNLNNSINDSGFHSSFERTPPPRFSTKATFTPLTTPRFDLDSPPPPKENLNEKLAKVLFPEHNNENDEGDYKDQSTSSNLNHPRKAYIQQIDVSPTKLPPPRPIINNHECLEIKSPPRLEIDFSEYPYFYQDNNTFNPIDFGIFEPETSAAYSDPTYNPENSILNIDTDSLQSVPSPLKNFVLNEIRLQRNKLSATEAIYRKLNQMTGDKAYYAIEMEQRRINAKLTIENSYNPTIPTDFRKITVRRFSMLTKNSRNKALILDHKRTRMEEENIAAEELFYKLEAQKAADKLPILTPNRIKHLTAATPDQVFLTKQAKLYLEKVKNSQLRPRNYYAH
uniref:Uncharacterized protein n=1 Tax=Rhabditophanes sp. KR3021 TaxID=114890 RepID=A0AC35U8S8_9BILA